MGGLLLWFSKEIENRKNVKSITRIPTILKARANKHVFDPTTSYT
jgi:hypothetical protein